MRKEITISLQETNFRNEPITVNFKIKQMSAIQQERWINRAIFALFGKKSLADLDFSKVISATKSAKKGQTGDGLKELVKLLGNLEYEAVEPLYDELLGCCYHIPSADNMNIATQCTVNNIDSIISDFRNLYRLRYEALKLNFGFLTDGVNSLPPQNKQAEILFTKRT